MRHVLTNVLGGSDDQVQVDVDLLPLENGDRLLLCSDGLTDLVDDDTIARRWPGRPAVRRLHPAGRSSPSTGGGKDNVTVIVAAYTLPDESAPPAT